MRLGYTSTDTFQYFTLSCSECIWCNRVLLGVRRRDICSFVSLFLVLQYIFLTDMWLRLA